MKFLIIGIVIAIVIGFLGATIANEGCLPWQERVGYGDGVFGDEDDFSRCDGSWFPFGSALVSVWH